MVIGAGEAAGVGAGDARLNVLSDNLFRGRPISESGRGGTTGAGEEGWLVGRKKDWLTVLRVSGCMVAE